MRNLYFANFNGEQKQEKSYPSSARVGKFQGHYVGLLTCGKKLAEIAYVVHQNREAA